MCGIRPSKSVASCELGQRATYQGDSFIQQIYTGKLRVLRDKPLPSANTQRYLAWIGVVGVFTFCFGCSRLMFNDIRAGNIFLIVAWFILVPLFLYLISTRRHIKRAVRKREAAHSEQRRAELDALGEMFGPGSNGDKVKAKE